MVYPVNIGYYCILWPIIWPIYKLPRYRVVLCSRNPQRRRYDIGDLICGLSCGDVGEVGVALGGGDVLVAEQRADDGE